MKTYTASKLADQLELEPTESSLYRYIVETYINGQLSQVKRLFDQLENHSQYNFIGYLREQEQFGVLYTITLH